MNKKFILDLLFKDTDKIKREYSEDDITLLNNITDTIKEMEVAGALFNYVSDPKLIELAIHAEDAAKTRYDYLISIAKSRDLRKID
ncbi:DUF2508 family protein [Clostridium sp. Sa3CUN1]|uniref:DUF2508 family protein n=1 Tax=Clostridium gallinarum TaxID=2762246 RepID=A0ABR8Q5H8_9CLOT|nr:DUF2508 family protein [Clostridium gallinarum]MBD7915549.1 DUF2508 family protein [Clostridium gallinarum]